MATSVAGRRVATGAVLTTDTEQFETPKQQDQDDDHDREHLHPAWCVRVGGRRLLWLVCAFVLVAVFCLALVLSAVYAVPSVWRVVLYLLGFVAPPILLATGALTLASGFTRTLPLQLVTAFVGGMIGLAVGIVVVVYVLGVW